MALYQNRLAAFEYDIEKIGLNTVRAKKTAADVKECVFSMLDEYVGKN